jgi:hypothetical protein
MLPLDFVPFQPERLGQKCSNGVGETGSVGVLRLRLAKARAFAQDDSEEQAIAKAKTNADSLRE